MTDDPYLKYNARSVHARTIDTLIGLSKGILADGVVNQREAEALLSWLEVNKATLGDHPYTNGLLARLHEMFWDDVLDDEEVQELHDILDSLSGGIPSSARCRVRLRFRLTAQLRESFFQAEISCSLDSLCTETGGIASRPCWNAAERF